MIKRVLIVDDNNASLYMLETLLKGYGFEVISAENGKDALDKARLSPPDLIVSDILMPVMDGYTLCRKWKSDDSFKQIPFVFYTATYTEPKDEAFALSLGAERFILKPQEPDVLMNLLKEVLEENYAVKQAVTKPLGEEMEFFRRHNEILFSKLEKKMLDLEIVNQKLRISEECYRLSFKNVSDVICTMDKELNIISMSPSVEKILGYKPQDFIGRPVTGLGNILTPESFEEAIADISLVSKGETIPAAIYLFIAKDGTIKYGEVSVSAIVREGEIVGIVSVARDITERKRSEEALRESEEKYRGILENMDDAYYELDLNGNLVFFNEALISKTGYSREELMGMNYRKYISPDTCKPVSRVFSEIYRTGRTVGLFDYEVIMKDGQTRNYESWAGLLYDTNNQTVGFRGMARDITARKQMEIALRESEGLFRKLFDDHAAVKLIIDPDTGNLIDANEAASQYYGWPRERLKEMKIMEINTLSPEEVKNEMEMARVNKRIHFEFRHRLADGSIRDVAVFSSSIESKGKVFLHSIIHDITERKRAEERLQETLESLRKAVGTTIQVMVSAVEARDPYTAGHQLRVAELVRAIATELGLSQEKIHGIRMAGSIHDIGKLSIPADILSKPTKLTEIEFSLIKEHARKGYEILKDIESSWPLAEIIYQHHERMDGSGYPRNMKGNDILMEARIMAVADVVEAIASHRPYRPSLGIDAALEEIEKNRRILYDDAVVEACLRLFREKGFKF